MFPSHADVSGAAAAAALHWLDQYRQSLAQLMREPGDASSYRRNAEVFDAMRGLTASLPLVQVCWVEVLISRFELFDALVRGRAAEAAQRRTDELLARHHASLATFGRLCARCVH